MFILLVPANPLFRFPLIILQSQIIISHPEKCGLIASFFFSLSRKSLFNASFEPNLIHIPVNKRGFQFFFISHDFYFSPNDTVDK